MIKLFYSGTYSVRHELINEDNVEEMLKNDMRSKIVGDVKKTIYPSDDVILTKNPKVRYIGGFYYEKQDKNKTVCENVVSEELKQIEKCDLVVVNLMNYSAIASITELLYASMLKKEIVIFCDSNITDFKVEGEYWFPILTSKQLNNNIQIKYVKDENEIINYINKLESI